MFAFIQTPYNKKPTWYPKDLDTVESFVYHIAVDNIRHGRGPIKVWIFEEFVNKVPRNLAPTLIITDEHLRAFKNAYYASESDPNFHSNLKAATTAMINPSKANIVVKKVAFGMYYAYIGDVNVGVLSLDDNLHHVTSVTVQPGYRRKGVATALYNFAEQDIGHKLAPSPTYQSEDAKAFWKSRKTENPSKRSSRKRSPHIEG